MILVPLASSMGSCSQYRWNHCGLGPCSRRSGTCVPDGVMASTLTDSYARSSIGRSATTRAAFGRVPSRLAPRLDDPLDAAALGESIANDCSSRPDGGGSVKYNTIVLLSETTLCS